MMPSCDYCGRVEYHVTEIEPGTSEVDPSFAGYYCSDCIFYMTEEGAWPSDLDDRGRRK